MQPVEIVNTKVDMQKSLPLQLKEFERIEITSVKVNFEKVKRSFILPVKREWKLSRSLMLSVD